MTTLGLGLGPCRRLRKNALTTAFAPSSLTGLAAWYDASDAASITHTSGAVSQWADKSGNARHYTQSTGANRPATGTRTLSGLNLIDFDGTSDYLDGPLSALNYGATTVFAVYVPDNTQNRYIIANDGTGGAQTRLFVGNQLVDFGNTLIQQPNPVVGVGLMQVSTVSGTGAATQKIRVGLNAELSGSVSRTGVATAARIGNYGGGVGMGNAMDGGIGEIIIYHRLLTSGEIDQVCAYLQQKWNVSGPPQFVSATNLPDASGGDAGKGFTCTGLAHDASDDTFWISNDGRNVFGDTSYLPSLVHVSKAGDAKLDEILLAPLFPSAQSIQGVTVDTSDNTLWFASFDEDLIRHVSKTGTNLGAIAVANEPNGLAYDPTTDSLLVLFDADDTIKRYDCATGALLETHNLGAHFMLDHLWFDPAANCVWFSVGANNTSGFIKRYNLTTGILSPAILVPDADSIEGIYMDGANLWVANDGYFHAGTPALNRLLKYAFNHRFPADPSILSLFDMSNASLTSGNITSLHGGSTSLRSQIGNVALTSGNAVFTGSQILNANAFAKFVSYQALPAASNGAPSGGFTSTGFDRVTGGTYAGAWVVCNYGRSTDAAPGTPAPSIVFLSPDFTTKLAEITIPSSATPQGCAFRKATNTIFYCDRDAQVIREINQSGTVLQTINTGVANNGLCYVDKYDCLIMAASTGTTRYVYSCATGTLMTTFTALRTADQLCFDQVEEILYDTGGANGTNGSVTYQALDLASSIAVRSPAQSGTIPGMQNAQAIEGIYIDRAARKLYLINDGGYHLAATPQLNIAITYDFAPMESEIRRAIIIGGVTNLDTYTTGSSRVIISQIGTLTTTSWSVFHLASAGGTRLRIGPDTGGNNVTMTWPTVIDGASKKWFIKLDLDAGTAELVVDGVSSGAPTFSTGAGFTNLAGWTRPGLNINQVTVGGMSSDPATSERWISGTIERIGFMDSATASTETTMRTWLGM